jgi:hypothetical protein
MKQLCMTLMFLNLSFSCIYGGFHESVLLKALKENQEEQLFLGLNDFKKSNKLIHFKKKIIFEYKKMSFWKHVKMVLAATCKNLDHISIKQCNSLCENWKTRQKLFQTMHEIKKTEKIKYLKYLKENDYNGYFLNYLFKLNNAIKKKKTNMFWAIFKADPDVLNKLLLSRSGVNLSNGQREKLLHFFHLLNATQKSETSESLNFVSTREKADFFDGCEELLFSNVSMRDIERSNSQFLFDDADWLGDTLKSFPSHNDSERLFILE